MSRPRKKRHVCAEPMYMSFVPRGKNLTESQSVVISLDEYECIRLMDYEEMTQEQCAKQMDVARTTVQAIYSSARNKIARCLVEGKELLIDGGNYVLCEKKDSCYKLQAKKKGDKWIMTIAVTYEDEQIYQFFGHTEQFKIYEVEDGKVVSMKIEASKASGHSALTKFLKEMDVNTLICGGIGDAAKAALSEAGIALFGGVEGSADNAVEALLKEELVFDPNVTCSRHGCGGHKCTH